MYNYQNFVPRVDTTPRVKRPMISKVYFAWCYQEKDEWHEGDCFLQPLSHHGGEYPNSIEELEQDRASKFDLDYEKDYYKDHYAMLVIAYRMDDKEYTIYLTPEHAREIIKHGINSNAHGVLNQPNYSWNELNWGSEEEE